MIGGEALMDELKKDRQGGLPWIVVLDGDGNELVSSVGPDGNIGCPATPQEIDHFVDMIKQSSDASEGDLTEIREVLNANAKKILGN